MWAPRLPSVAPVSFFSRENSRPAVAGSAFSAAMIFSRSGWWMMSSSSAIALAPAHPETAEDEPAAVDECHPQVERVTDVEIADQGQRDDTKADHNEGIANPQPCDGVDQHEIDRPVRCHLPRREMAEPAAREYSERDEQQQCHQHPDIESADAGSGIAEGADGERAHNSSRVNRKPGVTGGAWPEIRRQIARKNQRAPHDQHQAGEIIDPRPAHAARHLIDFDERFAGLFAVDHDSTAMSRSLHAWQRRRRSPTPPR